MKCGHCGTELPGGANPPVELDRIPELVGEIERVYS